jgi:hypothetical protein
MERTSAPSQVNLSLLRSISSKTGPLDTLFLCFYSLFIHATYRSAVAWFLKIYLLHLVPIGVLTCRSFLCEMLLLRIPSIVNISMHDVFSTGSLWHCYHRAMDNYRTLINKKRKFSSSNRKEGSGAKSNASSYMVKIFVHFLIY